MLSIRVFYRAALLATAVSLGACGGGGSGGGASNPSNVAADVVPSAPAAPSLPLGLDRFLLYPNPLVSASGAFESDTLA